MSDQWIMHLKYGISIQEPKPILNLPMAVITPKAMEYEFVVIYGYGLFQAFRDAVFGGIPLNNDWNFRWDWIRDIY